MSEKNDQQNQGSPGFKSVVTFEREKGDPVCVRQTIVGSAPDDVARRAVFRALPEAPRSWDSVVVVLDRLRAD